MAAITAETVKTLRDRSGAGIMKCKRALEQTGGDLAAAEEVLRAQGQIDASARAGRMAREGQVGAYIHPGGRLGAIVEINCETDFVARGPEFERLLRDLGMQVVALDPLFANISDIPPKVLRAKRASARKEAAASGKPAAIRRQIVEGQLKAWYAQVVLTEQPFRDQDRTVGQIISDFAAKTGENIKVRRFSRFELGG